MSDSPSYRIDAERKIVHILGPTPATSYPFEKLLEAIAADPGFSPGFGFLRDRRGMEPPSSEALRQFVAFLKRMSNLPRTRWALVVDTPANYGMARMSAILSDGSTHEVAIFEATRPAEEWLAESYEAEPSGA